MSIKIGLEIHCQINALKSKLFCSCSTDYRSKMPNTNICTICMGLPGSLPLLNKEAVRYAITIALALNCKIPDRIMFYRKNYFYPDLPKNFQITQYNAYGISSIGYEGKVMIEGKEIRIRRIQLEEDPGRLVYDSKNYTYVDYNRAGIPLVEIVTEPDFDDPKLVRIFLNKLSSILTHLNIDPELEGAVRCDANVSIDEGNRVEIKNVNSFKDVEKALLFEISRQKSLLSKGISVQAETRHWDDKRKVTIQSRSKEEEEDYRYFPEPDIPSLIIDRDIINKVKSIMPELPDERKERLLKIGLSENVAQVLVDDKVLADIFDDALNYYNNAREIANWIVGDLKGYIERLGFDKVKVTSKHIAELAKMVDNAIINRTVAKQILSEIIKTGEMPSLIAKRLNAEQISDKEELINIIDKVFDEDKKAVEDAMRNEKAINFLLGKVMKHTKGKADPKIALELIKRKISILLER
ncbi:MAG: glutamyl-tRNA amidotransferase [Candidatus Nitrosocaldaceae archaeon]|nr:MAG: glutamyl-tRNA amidotransferase [Candidatus Nitrosocaldaceae archaeon]